MILLSSCLLGFNCKYNGDNNLRDWAQRLLKAGKALPVCPEQMGGLSTPRLPSEIKGGDGRDVLLGKAKVIDRDGKDVSKEFIKGAEESLRLAKFFDIQVAIFKERSPSCGRYLIYDGTFTGQTREGLGVTSAILEENGIKVYSDEEEILWDNYLKEP